MGKSKARLKVKRPASNPYGVVAKRAAKPAQVKAKGKKGKDDAPKKVSTLVDRERRRNEDALRKHRVNKALAHNGTNLSDVVEDPLGDVLADTEGRLTISLTITAGSSRHLDAEDGPNGDSGLPGKD